MIFGNNNEINKSQFVLSVRHVHTRAAQSPSLRPRSTEQEVHMHFPANQISPRLEVSGV